MTTITEEDSHQSSSVARQVFPEDNPSVTVPVHEANASEEIPTAAADDRQEEPVTTPPTNQEVVLKENVSVPYPPATQVEVENTEAATHNATEANEVIMADANVAPHATTMNEANAAPATNVQLDVSANASAPVLPPRPHTIEHAFYQGELVLVRWLILVPPPTPGPQFDYHVEHRPQVHKPKPRLPRFPGSASAPGSFNVNGFIAHNTFFDNAKNPYSKPRISSDRFWSYQQRNYYSCILYNQGHIFPHMRLDCETIAGLPCLEDALDCFRDASLL